MVINLKQPVAAFLDYNASMYGPKIVSPTAVKQHTEGDDNATKWLSENEAGTGPYQLDSYKPRARSSSSATTTTGASRRRPRTIEFSVVPDIGDQILQLRSGQLDILTHGVDPQQIPSLEGDDDLQVQQFKAAIRPVLVLNYAIAPFDADAEARAGVRRRRRPAGRRRSDLRRRRRPGVDGGTAAADRPR